MKKLTYLLAITLLIASVIFLNSCATIATGTSQLITITSNVEGATIKIDGMEIGKTPFTGEVKKNGKIMTIEKDGYKTHQVALSTSLEGMFWGNIITGGTLGSITDFATGAAYKYSPASYQVELYKDDSSMNEFMENYELRKFAMVNMSNIAIDLSKNSGQYLETLIHLSSLENDQASFDIIKSKFNESNGDQVAFGNLMVELANANG